MSQRSNVLADRLEQGARALANVRTDIRKLLLRGTRHAACAISETLVAASAQATAARRRAARTAGVATVTLRAGNIPGVSKIRIA